MEINDKVINVFRPAMRCCWLRCSGRGHGLKWPARYIGGGDKCGYCCWASDLFWKCHLWLVPLFLLQGDFYLSEQEVIYDGNLLRLEMRKADLCKFQIWPPIWVVTVLQISTKAMYLVDAWRWNMAAHRVLRPGGNFLVWKLFQGEGVWRIPQKPAGSFDPCYNA